MISPTRSQFRCPFAWSSASSKSNSDVLISPGKRTGKGRLLSNVDRLRSADERLGGAADVVGDARLGPNEFRGEPREQSDEIVRDQDLAVAMRTGADADRGNCERFRNSARRFGSDNFEHDSEGAGLLPCNCIGKQRVGLRLSPAFYFVAAFLAHTL